VAPRRIIVNAGQERSIAHHFADLTNPRIDRSRLHELLDIMAISAVVAGFESCDDIEDLGEVKQDWLKSFLELPNGIPSHDTFRRLFEWLNPGEFQRGVLSWIESLHDATGRQVIAIDGKTLRRSFDRARGQSALHLSHAWAFANHLLLGLVGVDDKSNEITAIPKLLKMLSISGAIVTIDAMGCQKEIARTIRGLKADYLQALKANYEHLFEQVGTFFDGACAHGRKERGIGYHREWSVGHGRDECRRCWASSNLSWLEDREEWADLRSVVLIESKRFVGGTLAVEERYDLISLPADAKLLNEAVRAQWSVGTRCTGPWTWRFTRMCAGSGRRTPRRTSGWCVGWGSAC
jgi:hypothetical protein